MPSNNSNTSSTTRHSTPLQYEILPSESSALKLSIANMKYKEVQINAHNLHRCLQVWLRHKNKCKEQRGQIVLADVTYSTILSKAYFQHWYKSLPRLKVDSNFYKRRNKIISASKSTGFKNRSTLNGKIKNNHYVNERNSSSTIGFMYDDEEDDDYEIIHQQTSKTGYTNGMPVATKSSSTSTTVKYQEWEQEYKYQEWEQEYLTRRFYIIKSLRRWKRYTKGKLANRLIKAKQVNHQLIKAYGAWIIRYRQSSELNHTAIICYTRRLRHLKRACFHDWYCLYKAMICSRHQRLLRRIKHWKLWRYRRYLLKKYLRNKVHKYRKYKRLKRLRKGLLMFKYRPVILHKYQLVLAVQSLHKKIAYLADWKQYAEQRMVTKKKQLVKLTSFDLLQYKPKLKKCFVVWYKRMKNHMANEYLQKHYVLIFKGSAYLYLWRYRHILKYQSLRKENTGILYHTQHQQLSVFLALRKYILRNRIQGIKYHHPRHSIQPDMLFYQNSYKRTQQQYKKNQPQQRSYAATWSYTSPRGRQGSNGSNNKNSNSYYNNSSSNSNSNSDHDITNDSRWLRLPSASRAAESPLRSLALRRSNLTALRRRTTITGLTGTDAGTYNDYNRNTTAASSSSSGSSSSNSSDYMISPRDKMIVNCQLSLSLIRRQYLLSTTLSLLCKHCLYQQELHQTYNAAVELYRMKKLKIYFPVFCQILQARIHLQQQMNLNSHHHNSHSTSSSHNSNHNRNHHIRSPSPTRFRHQQNLFNYQNNPNVSRDPQHVPPLNLYNKKAANTSERVRVSADKRRNINYQNGVDNDEEEEDDDDDYFNLNGTSTFSNHNNNNNITRNRNRNSCDTTNSTATRVSKSNNLNMKKHHLQSELSHTLDSSYSTTNNNLFDRTIYKNNNNTASTFSSSTLFSIPTSNVTASMAVYQDLYMTEAARFHHSQVTKKWRRYLFLWHQSVLEKKRRRVQVILYAERHNIRVLCRKWWRVWRVRRQWLQRERVRLSDRRIRLIVAPVSGPITTSGVKAKHMPSSTSATTPTTSDSTVTTAVSYSHSVCLRAFQQWRQCTIRHQKLKSSYYKTKWALFQRLKKQSMKIWKRLFSRHVLSDKIEKATRIAQHLKLQMIFKCWHDCFMVAYSRYEMNFYAKKFLNRWRKYAKLKRHHFIPRSVVAFNHSLHHILLHSFLKWKRYDVIRTKSIKKCELYHFYKQHRKVLQSLRHWILHTVSLMQARIQLRQCQESLNDITRVNNNNKTNTNSRSNMTMLISDQLQLETAPVAFSWMEDDNNNSRNNDNVYNSNSKFKSNVKSPQSLQYQQRQQPTPSSEVNRNLFSNYSAAKALTQIPPPQSITAIKGGNHHCQFSFLSSPGINRSSLLSPYNNNNNSNINAINASSIPPSVYNSSSPSIVSRSLTYATSALRQQQLSPHQRLNTTAISPIDRIRMSSATRINTPQTAAKTAPITTTANRKTNLVINSQVATSSSNTAIIFRKDMLRLFTYWYRYAQTRGAYRLIKKYTYYFHVWKRLIFQLKHIRAAFNNRIQAILRHNLLSYSFHCLHDNTHKCQYEHVIEIKYKQNIQRKTINEWKRLLKRNQLLRRCLLLFERQKQQYFYRNYFTFWKISVLIRPKVSYSLVLRRTFRVWLCEYKALYYHRHYIMKRVVRLWRKLFKKRYKYSTQAKREWKLKMRVIMRLKQRRFQKLKTEFMKWKVAVRMLE